MSMHHASHDLILDLPSQFGALPRFRDSEMAESQETPLEISPGNLEHKKNTINQRKKKEKPFKNKKQNELRESQDGHESQCILFGEVSVLTQITCFSKIVSQN